jgi:hypothetical protein
VIDAQSQNATQLIECAVLAGWLHRTARNIASNVVRSEVRRRNREQEAIAMNPLFSNEPDATWEMVAPHLDAALGELDEGDRDALMLRYFERKTAREMAGILGLSEDAAQKRVSRAVERLRECLTRERVAIGAAAVTVLITANAVQAAPTGLAASITSALAGTAAQTSTLIAATKTIAVTTLQKTLIVAGLAAVAGLGIYASYTNSKMQGDIALLQQQQTPLITQLQGLQAQRDDASNQLAAAVAENSQKGGGAGSEISRLREEVKQLKADEAQRHKDPIASAAANWVGRVKILKDYLAQHPNEKIPELKYLTESDWLEASGMEFDNTNAVESAAQMLKFKAEDEVGQRVIGALAKYSDANNGQFPDNISELQPYSDPDIATILGQLYEVAPSSIVHDTITNHNHNGVTISYSMPPNILGQQVITRKVRPNPTSTTRFAIFNGGFTTWQSPPGSDDAQ